MLYFLPVKANVMECANDDHRLNRKNLQDGCREPQCSPHPPIVDRYNFLACRGPSLVNLFEPARIAAKIAAKGGKSCSSCSCGCFQKDFAMGLRNLLPAVQRKHVPFFFWGGGGFPLKIVNHKHSTAGSRKLTQFLRSAALFLTMLTN